MPFAECFDAATNTCPLIGRCRFRAVLESALEAFFSAMDEITLADLVVGNVALEHVLALTDSRAMASCH
jgi:Rrf2 family nitric oxide-sensitive transcriptional repressor